jgi:hypothetical protein
MAKQRTKFTFQLEEGLRTQLLALAKEEGASINATFNGLVGLGLSAPARRRPKRPRKTKRGIEHQGTASKSRLGR